MSDSEAILAQAAELDALGKHDDAVNVLARATQAGDLTAMTRLGKRLLVGDNAPYLPKEGARFIVDAANMCGGSRNGGRAAGRRRLSAKKLA